MFATAVPRCRGVVFSDKTVEEDRAAAVRLSGLGLVAVKEA